MTASSDSSMGSIDLAEALGQLARSVEIMGRQVQEQESALFPADIKTRAIRSKLTIDEPPPELCWDQNAKQIDLPTAPPRVRFFNDRRTSVRCYDPAAEHSWTEKAVHGLFGGIHGVTTEVEDRPVWLNTASLCKRLHFNRKEVNEAVALGVLDDKIDSKRFLPEAMDLFTKVRGYYEKPGARSAYVQTQDTKREMSFNFPGLLIIILMGFTELNGKIGETLFEFKGEKYLARRSGTNLQIIELVGSGPIGRGNSSSVYRTFDVTTGRYLEDNSAIFKQPRLEDPLARADFLSELCNLEHVRARGGSRGIQRPVTPIKNMIGKRQSGVVGYLSPAYDFDLQDAPRYSTWTNAPLNVKVDALHQLLTGLAFLDKIGMAHGALIGDNIFMDRRDDGFFDCHIADFGTAYSIKDKVDSSVVDNILAAISPSVTCANDMKALGQARMREDIKAMRAIHHKRDVFSAGINAYGMFTSGKSPFRLGYGEQGFPVTNTNFYDGAAFPTEPACGQLSDLIEAMLDPNIETRPSARRALKQLDKIIKERFPRLRGRA